MLFNIVCAFLCGIPAGVIIGFLICRPVIRQRMLEVETYWKSIVAKTSNDWKSFHQNEYANWEARTVYLINKATDDTNRLWQQRLDGSKPIKPKPSN